MKNHKVLLLSFLFIVLTVKVTIASTFSLPDFGAVPDDGKADTEAIQKAINACSENGGGTVLFPQGTWHSGTVYLNNNITIYLSSGAVWKGLNDSSAYPYMEARIMSREDRVPRKAMIYGYNLENIKIHGEGTIHPGGEYSVFENAPQNERPFGIYLIKCKNITVEGIHMEQPIFWMQRYFWCDNLSLHNLKIFNHSNRNNDGIDIDACHNVVVSGCIIDSSDDALVLKSEGTRACEDVVITNCILRSHASMLKLGTASIGGFKRITISNIIITPSRSKEMHHPIGSWRGLAGIDLLNVDGGVMEDILINNVIIDSVETPIFIKFGNRHDSWPGKPATTPGITRNIQISNVTIRNAGPICSSITGYPDHPVENIRLNDMYISVDGVTDLADTATQVIENSDGYPFNRMFHSNLPAYGLFLRHVNDIKLDNIEMVIGNEEVRPAMHLENLNGGLFEDVNMDQPQSNQPKVKVINSSNLRFDIHGFSNDNIWVTNSNTISLE